jgi:hypothetical protein
VTNHQTDIRARAIEIEAVRLDERRKVAERCVQIAMANKCHEAGPCAEGEDATCDNIADEIRQDFLQGETAPSGKYFDIANCFECGEFRGHGHECKPAPAPGPQGTMPQYIREQIDEYLTAHPESGANGGPEDFNED